MRVDHPFHLAAILLSITHPLLAGSASLQKHEKRVEELTSYQQHVCEHRSSEGEYFKCYQKLLKDFEVELESLTLDTKASLPMEQQASFQRTVDSWNRYYSLEKSHRDSMKAVQGSVHSIGYLTDLVELVKARCNLLLRQMA